MMKSSIICIIEIVSQPYNFYLVLNFFKNEKLHEKWTECLQLFFTVIISIDLGFHKNKTQKFGAILYL